MKLAYTTVIALLLTIKLFAQSEDVFKTLPQGTNDFN